MMDLSPKDNKDMYFNDFPEIQPKDPLKGLCGFNIVDS
jgi:hypothetical protein